MAVLEFRALKLILASGSARRRALLAQTGLSFEVLLPQVDETRREAERPLDYVLRLSLEKAREAASRSPAGALVLAADSAVVDGLHVLGKPAGPEDARRMLRQLRGRTHHVLTGLTLMEPGGRPASDVCRTDVTMRRYSDEEIEEYVAGGDPLDKAGAYAIQHRGFRPVRRIEGCYPNVVGLPLCHLTRALEHLGATSPGTRQRSGEVTRCRALPDYNRLKCPFYEQF